MGIEEFNKFLSVYSIDENYLKKVKKYFLFSDEDRKVLKDIKDKIKEIPEEVFDDFYAHLLSFEETKKILTKEKGLIEKLKKKQKDYLEFLLETDIDLHFVEKAFQIGKKHYENCVKLDYYQGAYLKYADSILKYLKNVLSLEELSIFRESFLKIIFIDLHFVIKTYYYFLNKKLKEGVFKYNAIVEGSFDGIVLLDLENRKILDVNKKIEEMTGLNRDELIGKEFTILHPPGQKRYIKNIFKQFLSSKKKDIIENVLIYNHKNKKIIPVEISGSVIEVDDKKVVIGIFRDITDRLEKEKQLERMSRLYRVLYKINEIIIKTTDVSTLFESILKVLIEEGGFEFGFVGEIENSHIKILKKNGNQEAFNIKANIKTLREAIKSKKVVEFDKNIGVSIPIIFADYLTSVLKIENKNLILALYSREIRYLSEDEKKLLGQIGYDIAFAIYSLAKKEEVKYLSYYDILTDLPNRRYFMERLENAIRQAKSSDESLAVLLIDIDRFKNINEVFGQLVGDLALKELSKRISGVLRSRDIIARFGNDEFAVLAFDIKNKEDVIHIIRRIRNQLEKPFNIEDKEIFLTVSIGVALFPQDGKTSEEILSAANSAIKDIKSKGGNGFEFYSPELKKVSLEILKLESALRKAVKSNEFILYYQPIVELKSMKIKGVEALIRWNHPKKGLIPPFEFIPILEETGMIVEVGEWVIEEAIKQQRKWDNFDIDISVSLNISTKQLIKASLSEMVLRKLKENNGNPKKLVIEITESALMENINIIREDIERLAKEGIRVEIDDFGTGYSSLAYLKKLPVYALKIDREFIKDIPEDKDDIAIVKAIVSMAKSLDKKTIAEGIETHHQLNFLKELGCDYGQGYLFSPPLSSDEFENLFKEFNNKWKK